MRLFLSSLIFSAFIASATAGKWFDMYVVVILENEDFSSTFDDAYFQSLASTGVLHTSYYAATHPSQPNYWAMIAGDYRFPGQTYLGGQNTLVTSTAGSNKDFDIYNTNTIVDLLDSAGLDYKIYSEDYPTSGSCYLGTSSGGKHGYVRKHNPFISFKTFTDSERRCAAQKDFNDMYNDFANGVLAPFSFVIPNLNNDGHDTSVSYSGQWLSQFIEKLKSNTAYTNCQTLVHVVYDEDDGEGSGNSNRVYSLLFGTNLPSELVGTTDDNPYTHYSILATIEENFGLGNLGKNDVGASVFNLGAAATAPTPPPAPAPTTAPKCRDSSTATFKVPNKTLRKKCRWLRSQKANQITSYCTSATVKTACPLTCKAC